jgi:sugar/nucleoside kinase (ribokinase family)
MFNKMYDIITFGSAAQDIHVNSGSFRIVKDNKDFSTGEGICLPFGSKIDVESIVFTSGGGGTNTAATFARQGFKTAFCGAIGTDAAGLDLVRELKHFRIDTKFLVKKKEKQTNCSVVVSNGAGDRTILVYRGASELLCKVDIPWRKLRAKWFYSAPLAGSLCVPEGGQATTFEEIVNFAYANKIKIAINPSKKQLSMPEETLGNIFSKVNILFLNQEEASYLTKLPFQNEEEIFKEIDKICPGVAVMTKGAEGVVVSDGKYLYSAKPNPDRKVVDTTGAGDSFASGFLSGYIKFNGDIIKSIQLGLGNSEACLSQVGAKSGLLDKKSDFKRVEVLKQECGENNLCTNK